MAAGLRASAADGAGTLFPALDCFLRARAASPISARADCAVAQPLPRFMRRADRSRACASASATRADATRSDTAAAGSHLPLTRRAQAAVPRSPSSTGPPAEAIFFRLDELPPPSPTEAPLSAADAPVPCISDARTLPRTVDRTAVHRACALSPGAVGARAAAAAFADASAAAASSSAPSSSDASILLRTAAAAAAAAADPRPAPASALRLLTMTSSRSTTASMARGTRALPPQPVPSRASR